MRWPWRREEPQRRYCCIDEEWRQFNFMPNTWSGSGETCQCEPTSRGWDRRECGLHGPSGSEFYDRLRPGRGRR